MKMVQGFFYIFGNEGNTKAGEVTGVPSESGGIVFMGFCKPDIRTQAQPNDWIIGISNAKLRHRRILSIIEVKDKPKLWEAIRDYPHAIWSKKNPRGQIYVKEKRIDNDYEYEYIKGAPHNEENRLNDMKKYPHTDRLIVGSSNSLILGRYGYPVDKKIMSIIRKDARLKQAKIDVNAPLGRMYNKKIGTFVASSYPRPAIVELSKSDIDFLKDIVRTVKKKFKKPKESSSKSIDGGY